MRTRIKILTRADGTKRYLAQRKVWLIFWRTIRVHSLFLDGPFVGKFDTMEEAQSFLDDRLHRMQMRYQTENAKKIVKTETVDYPPYEMRC